MALPALGALATTLLVAACARLPFAIANAAGSFGDYERIDGIAYGTDERQQLDVFVPKGDAAARPFPVVVFWYGGSWTRGDRGQYAFAGAALADAGVLTVLPDYRMYPEVRFPAFIEDGAAALAWVRVHASDYGGDPERIFLMGHSAGAHMAAMVGLAQPDAVRGIIGLSGPYALTPNSATLDAIFGPPYTPADWRPAERVTSAAPPALIIHGGGDTVVVPSHAERFALAYAAVGAPAELHIYSKLGHADTVAALSVPARNRAPVLAQSLAFIAAPPERAAPAFSPPAR